jgi:hypothetical protein
MTPKHWRWVRITPNGRRFKLVYFYTHGQISEGDAKVFGFSGAKSFVGLTKAQALFIGEAIEKKLLENEPARKKRETNVLQNNEAKFTLQA